MIEGVSEEDVAEVAELALGPQPDVKGAVSALVGILSGAATASPVVGAISRVGFDVVAAAMVDTATKRMERMEAELDAEEAREAAMKALLADAMRPFFVDAKADVSALADEQRELFLQTLRFIESNTASAAKQDELLEEVSALRQLVGSMSSVAPDVRRRMRKVLAAHRLFGGRDEELARLHEFAREDGYYLVGGRAGSGKSALLANFVTELEEAGKRVAYAFISRRHGLTERDELVSILVQQLRGSGENGSGDLVAELLELLERDGEVVVVIDALDEAEWEPDGGLFPATLGAGVTVVLSARSDDDADWEERLQIAFEDKLALDRLSRDGIRALLERSEAPAWAKSDEAIARLDEVSAGDAFYLRHLVEDLTPRGGKARIGDAAALAKQPTKLDDYFARWWKELQKKSEGAKVVADVLGFLLLAQGPLRSEELGELVETDGESWTESGVEDAIEIVRRFLVGDEDDGWSLCHWRFQDYLMRKRFRKKARAPYLERLVAWCGEWDEHESPYAIRHAPEHLLEAGRGEAVLGILEDPQYQELRAELGDVVGLRRDAERAVEALAEEAALGLLVRAAHLPLAVEERWVDPAALFELAEEGEVERARRRVALFGAAPEWRSCAELLVAWSDPEAPGAEALYREVADAELLHPLPMLAERVGAGFGGEAPSPALGYPGALPSPPPRDVVEEIIGRIAGSLDPELMVSGIESLEGKLTGEETPTYVVEGDMPSLVAFANADGTELLARYIGIHASNPYGEYRNRSLWAILGGLLAIEDDGDARELLRATTEAALQPGTVAFREALGIAARVLQAEASGDTGELEEITEQARELANGLHQQRWNADSWGHHARRLAALAEGWHALGNREEAEDLLDLAGSLPFGFAGYQSLASLTLAEANRIVRPKHEDGADALEAARRSAHNVQEPSFCARMTARHNAWRSRRCATRSRSGSHGSSRNRRRRRSARSTGSVTSTTSALRAASGSRSNTCARSTRSPSWRGAGCSCRRRRSRSTTAAWR